MDANLNNITGAAGTGVPPVVVEGGSVGSQRTHFGGRDSHVDQDPEHPPKADSSEGEGTKNSGNSKKRLVLGAKVLPSPLGLPPLVSAKGVLHSKKRQNSNAEKEEDAKKPRKENEKQKSTVASPSSLSPGTAKPRADRETNLQIASGWRSPLQHQSLDTAAKSGKRLRDPKAQEEDLNRYWWKRINSSSLPRTRNLAKALQAQEPTEPTWVTKAISAPVVRMRLINVASLEYPTLSHIIWKDPGSLKALEEKKRVMAISGWVLWQFASNSRGFWTLSNTRDVFDLGRRHLYGPRQASSRSADLLKSTLSWYSFNACEFAARIALSVAGFTSKDLADMTINNRIGSHFASLYIETGGQPPNGGYEIEKELLARLAECPSSIKEPTSSPRETVLKLEGPPQGRSLTDAFEVTRKSTTPPSKPAKPAKAAKPTAEQKVVIQKKPEASSKDDNRQKVVIQKKPEASSKDDNRQKVVIQKKPEASSKDDNRQKVVIQKKPEASSKDDNRQKVVIQKKPEASSQLRNQTESFGPEPNVAPKAQIETWPSTELSAGNETASLRKLASTKRISGSGLDVSTWSRLIKELESDDE